MDVMHGYDASTRVPRKFLWTYDVSLQYCLMVCVSFVHFELHNKNGSQDLEYAYVVCIFLFDVVVGSRPRGCAES